jgi:DNA (cytosine-5)-methyltransferase 1
MIQTGYGEREGQAPRALDLEQPLGTVVAGGSKHGLVAANLIGIDNQSGTGVWPADAPLTTATTKARHAVVAASIMTNTSGHAPSDVEQPLPTVTTGNHQALVAAFIQHYYGQGTQAQDPGAPLHTVTTIARHGLVTVEIDGETYIITDIGMRMLEPAELATAMGFPSWYHWLKADGAHLTKRDQVKMIGNAVPPPLAKALVLAVARPRPELFGFQEGIA